MQNAHKPTAKNVKKGTSSKKGKAVQATTTTVKTQSRQVVLPPGTEALMNALVMQNIWKWPGGLVEQHAHALNVLDTWALKRVKTLTRARRRRLQTLNVPMPLPPYLPFAVVRIDKTKASTKPCSDE
jgi:hypothetical protein